MGGTENHDKSYDRGFVFPFFPFFPVHTKVEVHDSNICLFRVCDVIYDL